MKRKAPRLFFDANDYKLLAIVNDVLRRGSRPQSLSSLMAPYMHPRGIKEMAAPSGLRIAYAIVDLLGSLEAGKAAGPHRRPALPARRGVQLLHHDFQKNTARVLLQIMKELVRSRGNDLRQLKLAHDFRTATAGKPRLVRRQLRRHHLLEMPEEWNQIAFDDHVHDANTKGRKSPTHLIMDAWIKGIRRLTVIYYNHVEDEVAAELLEAGSIMDIHVRIGIELSSGFRGHYVRFVWELEGFFDNHDLLRFLDEPPVQALIEEGREVSRYQQRYVLAALGAFNRRHRPVLDGELGVSSRALDEADFLRYVGTGQPSLLHLAKYIQDGCRTLLEAEVERIHAAHPHDTARREAELAACASRMERLSLEAIIARFLQPCCNPGLHDPTVPHDEGMPPLLHVEPPALLGRLAGMHSGSRFTLNLSNLTIQDTLELLYLCEGRITHIEAFNLKDAGHGMTAQAADRASGFAGDAVDVTSPARNYQLINMLQKALNEDNVITLKRAIRSIIWEYERSREITARKCEQGRGRGCTLEEQERLQAELAAMDARKEALLDILTHIGTFHDYYNKRYLGSRIGSGSTGQSQQQHGMGLVVLDTLPRCACREVLRDHREEQPRLVPVTARMISHRHVRLGASAGPLWVRRLFGRLPGFAGGSRWHDWSLDRFVIHPGTEGNIVTLGGVRRTPEIELHPAREGNGERIDRPIRYCNTHLLNILKVVAGFIPAFLTFGLTKDWWVLAYLGAFIWFGITGVRNIIQSVLGGGGFKRSPLLLWNSLVSWSRIADSLFTPAFPCRCSTTW